MDADAGDVVSAPLDLARVHADTHVEADLPRATADRLSALDGSGGPVTPDEVVGEKRAGRKVVLTGDTAPCEMTQVAAHSAQLLVHDGTFAVKESARAAEIASESEVKLLALTHLSPRHPAGELRAEAREVFDNTVVPRDFDLVEIPFPERGEPHLVPEGAKQRPEPRAEPAPIPD